MSLRLIVFDVDGTLVDSQAHIVAAMRAAFEGQRLEPPSRAEVLTIVGLSLPVAVARLAPEADHEALAAGYRSAFAALRARPEGASPLYPGARAALDRLGGRDDILLAVATGKSRRGLDHVLTEHGLDRHFVSVQTADGHPSKPHPAMLQAAVAEAGVEARSAVMVGDTTFDIEMALSAGVTPLGVRWGYHPSDALSAAGAVAMLDNFDELDAVLDRLS